MSAPMYFMHARDRWQICSVYRGVLHVGQRGDRTFLA